MTEELNQLNPETVPPETELPEKEPAEDTELTAPELPAEAENPAQPADNAEDELGDPPLLVLPAEKPQPPQPAPAAPAEPLQPAPAVPFEPATPAPQPPVRQTSPKPGAVKQKNVGALDKLFLDETGDEGHNYTGDEMSERDYRPVRQSREYRSGCLGGLMYFVFIICVSVILACFAWMAVSDALALNKDTFTVVVNLPSSAFETKTVEELDENGNVIGMKNVRSADIRYVSTELKEAGLIQYKWLFEFFCKLSHADTKMTPGTYELKSSFDYRALVQNMRAGSGATVTIDVTFPEGFTMRQIFLRLEENEVCSYEDLMEAAANYKYNYSFLEGMEPGDAARLEGFLFPDTYQFYVGMQASSAINKFLERFYYLQTADMLKQAADRGLDMRQVVTIASLIEKEAAVDLEKGVDERRMVASVIYNRLEAGMPLGIDASILYLYPDHSGAPTGEMLAVESPYNTRLSVGLPPTPICSPSLASIKAALNPESSNYYYYALNTETGRHEFFTRVEDFNAFVATQNYEDQ
ncbi:MAG: endolytic transglycosylase MltG [Oscillospiraceae bacterium]|nr:endolytic transglycosylase MltG [Oscillospiraceae bacterium]